MDKKSPMFRIAFGGICLGLALVALFLASFVPGIQLTLLAIASLFTAVMIIEIGIPNGVLLFIGASLLGFLIIPNKAVLIPYVLCFGYYPICKYYIEKINKGSLQMLVKVVYFAFVCSIAVIGLQSVLAVGIKIPDLSMWLTILGGLVMLVIYDYILSLLISYY
ncbi:MAG: hypothetical protein Q4B78_02625, partial [Bacillota bacterium]|nr:hypothetical protein [Bacillota bacterium]